MTKFRISLLFLLLSHAFICQVPSYLWANGIGNSNNVFGDQGMSVSVDASGNSYVTGAFYYVMDADPSPATFTLNGGSNGACFVTKYDSNGNFLWAFSLSAGYGSTRITCDSVGNFYLMGYFGGGSIDLDPSPAGAVLTGGGGFIAKYNTSGNFLWGKYIMGSWVYPLQIRLDKNYDLVVGGDFQLNCDFDVTSPSGTVTSIGQPDAFLAKYDTSGNFQWVKSFGSKLIDNVWSVDFDSANNIVISGMFGDTCDFDPSPATAIQLKHPSSSGNGFIAKYSPLGNYLWAKNVTYGPGGYKRCKFVNVDINDNIVVTGNCDGVTDFDPSAAAYTVAPIGPLWDLFFCKYNSSGNFIWARRLGSTNSNSEGNCIKTDKAGNVILCGAISGTVDMDPSAVINNLNSIGASDIVAAGYDPSGNYKWAFNVGSSQVDVVQNFDMDSLSNLYLTGCYQYTTDFDPSPSTATLISNGNLDFFVAKYNACFSPEIPMIASTSSTICANTTTTLTITSGNLNSAVNWQWYSGNCGTNAVGSGTAIMITPSVTTNYFVRGEGGCIGNAGNCQSLTIVVLPSPSVNITSSNTQLCTGDSATLTAQGALSYTWNNGATSFSIIVTPTITSTYTITGTGINACEGTAVISQSVNALPLIGITSTHSTLCINQSATLTATGGITYTWSTGANNTSIVVTPSISTTYTVYGTDNNGCVNSNIYMQQIDPCAGLNEPFSEFSFGLFPNPANEYVHINCSLKTFIFELTDNIGRILLKKEIHNSTSLDVHWVDPGIYFYKIFSKENTELKQGKLILSR
jgi:hypothetical protein